jgi:hypothetical protein
MFQVVLVGELPFEFREHTDAAADFFGRNLVWHCGSRRAIATTEGKDVDLHEASCAAGIECLLKFGFALAGKSNDDVGTEGCGWTQHLADLLQPVEETLHAVASTHAGQNRVTAALQGRVELGAEMFAVTAGADEIVIDLDRFDAGEAHSPVAGDTIQSTQKMPQSGRRIAGRQIIGIHPIVTHVNATDDNLSIPVVNEGPHFFFDVRSAATAEPRTNGRNNAV